MTWFWLALGSAFFLATSDFLTKRHFSDLPVTQMIQVRLLGLVPVSLALLLVIPVPPIQPQFYWSIGLALPADVLALFLYLRGIQASPLALSVPFLAFTPLFVILTGLLLLGEMPNWPGVAGMLLVVAGAYVLNLDQLRQGWAAPFRAVFSEKGSWLLLLTSLIFAYTITMGKKALLASGPWFMAAVYPMATALLVAAVLALTSRLAWDWLRRPWAALGVGLCTSATLACHFGALALAPAAYMVAIKRLSILMAVLYGGVFLKEARLGQHLLAGGLMVGGAVVILLMG